MFNGKELDEDTGLYYYGARYYESKVSQWLSVDPLAEKTMESYIYCGNNPIDYSDPTGLFKIPIHRAILKEAFNSMSKAWREKFTYLFYLDLNLGVGDRADIIGAGEDNHFDGRKNFAEVQARWKSLTSEIDEVISDIGSGNRNFGGNDAVTLGVKIHNVQDFYSHSNYIELWESMYGKTDFRSIPTLTEAFENPIYNKFYELLEKKLVTGDYPGDGGSESHKGINKDVGYGSSYASPVLTNTVLKEVKGKKVTWESKAAEAVATKDVRLHNDVIEQSIK